MNETGNQFSAPFDAIANQYDQYFDGNWVTGALRALIWKKSLQYFSSGQHILELNCGTGTDALYFASRGIRVTALDASPEMIHEAKFKAAASAIPESSVRFFQMRNEDIANFGGERFDGLFSNFGGLNCVEDLKQVVHSWKGLLKPQSPVILCFLNKVYLWEIASFLLRGNSEGAFRRFHKSGVDAQLETTTVRVWYYSPRELKALLAPSFKVEKVFGLNILSPNPNSRFIISQYPSLTKTLLTLDEKINSFPVIRGLGDHVVIIAKYLQ